MDRKNDIMFYFHGKGINKRLKGGSGSVKNLMLYVAESKRKFIEMVNRLFQSSSRDKRVCSRRRTWKFEAFLFKFQSVQLGPVSPGSQIDQSQSENGLAM